MGWTKLKVDNCIVFEILKRSSDSFVCQTSFHLGHDPKKNRFIDTHKKNSSIRNKNSISNICFVSFYCEIKTKKMRVYS